MVFFRLLLVDDEDDGGSFPRTLPVVEDCSHGFCVDDLAARGGLVIFFGHWLHFFHIWSCGLQLAEVWTSSCLFRPCG